MRVYKRFGLASQVQSLEALGQLRGSDNLEHDIALCACQTIEPYFLKYLPNDEKILEAGCGRGRWVYYLRRRGYEVEGIDIAKTDIEFSTKYDPTVPITFDNVLQTSFEGESFGAVISLGVVEHFEEGPQDVFGEVLRVLKPGGLFFVTVPTQNIVRIAVINRLKDVQVWIRKLLGLDLAFEEFRYSRKQFRYLLDQAGFDVIDCAPDDFLPPKNMGLWIDSRLFQHPSRLWELNRIGKVLNALLGSISPWLHCCGTLWVCRKPS